MWDPDTVLVELKYAWRMNTEPEVATEALRIPRCRIEGKVVCKC